MKSSHKLWNSIGDNVEKYLNVLRRIAINFNTIARKSNLIAEMKKAPILLAVKKRRSISETKDSNEEADHYSLASANDIFINDDTVYQQVFNPLTVPEEDSMESLYKVCRLLNIVVIIYYTAFINLFSDLEIGM